MIKAILFDLDNTLVDFNKMKKLCTEAAVKAMIKAGLQMKEEKAISIIFKMYNKFGIENHTIYQKFLKKEYNEIDYKILSAGIIAYRKVRHKQVTPYPYVKSTLIKLKKEYRLGVISDAPRMQVWLRLTEMGLTDFFDIILGFEDTGKLKPSVVPFKKALEIIKLKPDSVLYVGDNPKRDIIGAKRAGMKTALIGQDNNADYNIKNIKELIQIL